MFTNTLNVGTLNINGAREKTKRLTLIDFIMLKRIHVMMVQETHCDKINEVDWRKEWNGEIFFSHKSSVSGGVAVLFAKDFLPCSCQVDEIRSTFEVEGCF